MGDYGDGNALDEVDIDLPEIGVQEVSDGFAKKWKVEWGDYGSLLLGFNRARQPLSDRHSLTVLPNMYSWDNDFLIGLRAMDEQLNSDPNLKPVMDQTTKMVGKDGIAEPFNLKCVAGFGANPMSYVPCTNDALCETLKIPEGFRSEADREIFDEFFEIIFSSWKPTSIKVPKLSTMGMPCLSIHDAAYKRDAAIFLYSNIDKILRLVRARDFETLAVRYGMIFAYNNGKRSQVDTPGKVRLVFDLEYARTGGRSGKAFAADKSVSINGIDYPDFSATRERVVQGAPWALNCIIQSMAAGHMKAMFERFPGTFHHTDPQMIADECAERGDATFSDVSEYDRSMRSFLIERMFDKMREVWDEGMVSIAEWLYFSAYYTRPVDATAENPRGVWFGQPWDPTIKQIHSGNRSGHAMTSFVAKTMKVFDSLCIINRITHDVRGNVRRYLEHTMPICLFNNGDDEGAAGSPALINAYRNYRYDPENRYGYFSVKPENGQVFSGTMIRWTDGPPQAIPRIGAALQKMYIPERAIGTTFRKNWPIGFFTRLKAIAEHPSGHYVEEVHNRVWRDIWEPRYGTLASMLATAVEQLDVNFEALSTVDREVLEDPDKLQWKYTEDDVSKTVLDKVVISILPEDLKWCHKFYNGLIL